MGRRTAWAACSAALALLIVVAAPGVASASACCASGTSDQAGRLGDGEDVLLGAGASAELLLGEWDAAGLAVPSAVRSRVVHRVLGYASFRAHWTLQGGFTVPVVVQVVRVGKNRVAGAAPGDVSAWIRWEPIPTGWRPGWNLELSLPTGVAPEASPVAFAAGATGTGYAALTPSFDLERVWTKGHLRLSVDGRVSLPRPGAPRTVPGVRAGVQGAGGIYLTTRSTLAIAGGVNLQTPGLHDGDLGGRMGAEPWLSVGGAFTVGAADRIGVGLRTSLFVPHLGRSAEATAQLSITYSHVPR